MNSEIENIIEGILNIAMSEGGNVYFHNTFLANENDMKKLDKINLQLSMYGEIHGMMLGGHWTYFKINPKGIDFIEKGSYKGKRERENIKVELDRVNLEIANMQKEKLEYERTIRHQEKVIRLYKYAVALSWFITLVVGVLSMIIYNAF